MLHHLIEIVLPEIISFFEILGIIVIIGGAFKTVYNYFKSVITHHDVNVRIQLGNALALGLEFKMGAEILKTVLITDFKEIIILGAIIVLRAILAFLIHWEISNEKKEHMAALKESGQE